MKLRIDIGDALAGLSDYGNAAAACIAREGASAAARLEDFAKVNRPWTDRTGNARRTLEGVAGFSGARGKKPGGVFSVGIEGHMPYSVFLELGFDGRFAILAPTVRHFAPDVLLQFAGGLAGLR